MSAKRIFVGFALVSGLLLAACSLVYYPHDNPLDSNYGANTSSSTSGSSTYKIKYDGNGNTGGTAPVDTTAYAANSKVTIPGNTGGLTLAGKHFIGWNTKADGSGSAIYTEGTTITISAVTTLYALWTDKPVCTVVYDGNGATAGTVPTNTSCYIADQSIVLAGNTGNLTRTNGTSFGGWTQYAGSSSGSAQGSTITVSSVMVNSGKVTLYVVWKANANTYTISYNPNLADNGTPPIDTTYYSSGQTITVMDNVNNMSRAGYTFAGWNTQSDGKGTAYAAGATITMGTGNIILYAQWAYTKFSLTYDANGATGGTVPVDSTQYSGDNVAIAVLDNTGNLVKNGLSFTGWNTKADGSGIHFNPASTIYGNSSRGSLTLYADWQLFKVTGIACADSSFTMAVGEQYPMGATLSPANATNPTINWTSSNTSVATITATGIVTTLATGTTTLTVVSQDGAFADSCSLTVDDSKCLRNVAAGRHPWESVCLSRDGKFIAALAGSDGVYTSADRGVTWVAQPNTGTHGLYHLSMATDASLMVALGDKTYATNSSISYIYVSTDKGSTWVRCDDAGIRNWTNIRVSRDGSRIVACSWGGYLFTSTDKGTTWTPLLTAGARLWSRVAVSTDGSTIVASATNNTWTSGELYKSTDYGATWSSLPTLTYVVDLWMSADGQVLYAQSFAQLYVSRDGGANWVSRANPNTYWQNDQPIWRVTASDTGTTVFGLNEAAEYRHMGSYIPYFSTDAGNTWTSMPRNSFYVGMVSGDGSLLAVTDYSFIYLTSMP
jgi:uncharacterized repeat protein (TIGR02543 family)